MGWRIDGKTAPSEEFVMCMCHQSPGSAGGIIGEVGLCIDLIRSILTTRLPRYLRFTYRIARMVVYLGEMGENGYLRKR